MQTRLRYQVVFTAMSTILLPAVSGSAETVVVRSDTPLTGTAGGPADTRFTGFLLSLTPTAPGNNYFEALNPRSFRTGVLTNINGNVYTGDFQTYDRVRNAGATFEYLMSDAVYVRPPDDIEWPGGPKDPTYSKWEALLDAKISAAKVAGGGTYIGRWDIWNEPDYKDVSGNFFWPYDDAAGAQQFFETWRRGYQRVRAQLPGVPIVGPSMAFANHPTISVDSFLDYAKANNVLPDIVTFHVFDHDDVSSRVNAVKSSLTSRGINRPVALNEYVGPHEQSRPGVLPHYFSAMQNAGVSYGIHATWSEPVLGGGEISNAYNDSLDGLLTSDTKQPRSTWWVYKRYSEMTGNMVQVDAGTSVTGLASLNATNDVATILLGRDVDSGTLPAFPPDAVTLQLDGIIASMGIADGTPLTVELQRIADSGYYASSGPVSIFVPLVANAGSMSVVLRDFGWTDAYFVKVAAIPEPASIGLVTLVMAAFLRRQRYSSSRSLHRQRGNS